MKHFVPAVLALLLLAAPALAEAPVGDIMNASGKVTIARGTEKTPAAAGGQLLAGDVLATGSDGAVGVSFADGSRLSLGAESEMRMDSYVFEPQEKKYGMEVFLRKGVAAISTGKMAGLAPEAMNITTPLATLGIRGTKFLVKAQ